LLNAVGLSEMIATTSQEYEDLALNLAHNPEKLSAIESLLQKNKDSYPLFNTRLNTKSIEHVYRKMHDRRLSGQLPDHFDL
jgi:hypothetical protein